MCLQYLLESWQMTPVTPVDVVPSTPVIHDRCLSVRGSGVFFVEAPLCVIISLSARRFLMSPLPPLFPPTQPPPCVLMANSNKRLQQSSTLQKITAFEARTSCDFRVNTEQANYLLMPPLKIRNRAQLRVTKKQTPPSQTESEQENDAVMKITEIRGADLAALSSICNQDVCAHMTRSHRRHNRRQAHTRLSG